MYNPVKQFVVFAKYRGLVRIRGRVIQAPSRATAREIYTARGIHVTAVLAEWEFNACLMTAAAVACGAVLLTFARLAPSLFA